MTDDNNVPDEPVEGGEPEFKNLDDVVSFVRGELDELKKLAKKDSKKRTSKDDFRLYHEQTEQRLDQVNERLQSIEAQAENFLEKLTHRGTEFSFQKIWDFFFKP